jgi:cation transporter-like permease
MAATTLHVRTRDETALGRALVAARTHGPGLLTAVARAGHRLRRLLLTVAALACLVYAAFLASVILGFTAAGVAFLWVEWLTTPEAPPDGSVR